MKCSQCHWEYPESYLDSLSINFVETENVCGICALELINECHGVKWDKFSGPLAEKKRQDAIEWRLTHPTIGDD